MAAGEGRRLRPITERWPKPVLPIDGRPVVVTLVHELAAAGCGPIAVVTGHLADQVEELLKPLPYDLRFVRQPPGLGSADAVARAQATPPYLVTAADTVYTPGDLARFAGEGRPPTARSPYTAASGHPSGWSARSSPGTSTRCRGAAVQLAHVFRDAVEAGAQVSEPRAGGQHARPHRPRHLQAATPPASPSSGPTSCSRPSPRSAPARWPSRARPRARAS